MSLKSWFIGKMNAISQSLARRIRRKERAHKFTLFGMKGDITIDSADNIN